MRYESPKSTREAVALMAGAKGNAFLLAGGTDLLVRMITQIDGVGVGEGLRLAQEADFVGGRGQIQRPLQPRGVAMAPFGFDENTLVVRPEVERVELQCGVGHGDGLVKPTGLAQQDSLEMMNFCTAFMFPFYPWSEPDSLEKRTPPRSQAEIDLALS